MSHVQVQVCIAIILCKASHLRKRNTFFLKKKADVAFPSPERNPSPLSQSNRQNMEKISKLFQNQKADADGADDDINDAVDSLSIKTPLTRGFRASRAEGAQAKPKFPSWTIKVHQP
jgi:hypothetical protein